MAFDINTARPVDLGRISVSKSKFDINTAKPVKTLQTKMIEGGNWVGGGLLRTAKDIGAIPAHFVNQYALNLPRYAFEKMGMKYPEETESGAASMLAHGAGIGGAVLSPVNKLAALGVFKPILGVGKKASLAAKAGSSIVNMAKNAGIGAVTSGLYASDLKDKPGQMLAGATLGAGLPAVGGTALRAIKGIPVAGRAVARSVGQLNDQVIKIGHDIGWDKVFDPVKQSSTYLADVAIPKVKQKMIDIFQNIADTPKTKQILSNIGYKFQEVKDLVNLHKSSLDFVADKFKRGFSMEEGIDQFKTGVKKEYEKFIRANPNAKIMIRGTERLLRNSLIKMGWMDLQDNLKATSIIGKEGINPSQQILYNLYNRFKASKDATIDGATYLNWLNELETVMKGDPSKAVVVKPLMTSLRNKAKRAIPGLKQINEKYSDMFILDDHASKLGKIFSDDGIMTMFKELSPDVKYFDWNTHDKAKYALGKDIYDMLMTKHVNDTFRAEGWPSLAFLRDVAVKKGAQYVYKNIVPAVEKMQGSKVANSMKTAFRDYMASGEATANKAGELLKSVKGSVDFSQYPTGPGKADAAKHITYLRTILKTTRDAGDRLHIKEQIKILAKQLRKK